MYYNDRNDERIMRITKKNRSRNTCHYHDEKEEKFDVLPIGPSCLPESCVIGPWPFSHFWPLNYKPILEYEWEWIEVHHICLCMCGWYIMKTVMMMRVIRKKWWWHKWNCKDNNNIYWWSQIILITKVNLPLYRCLHWRCRYYNPKILQLTWMIHRLLLLLYE